MNCKLYESGFERTHQIFRDMLLKFMKIQKFYSKLCDINFCKRPYYFSFIWIMWSWFCNILSDGSTSQWFFQVVKQQKNGQSPIPHPRLPKWSQLPKTKRIFEILWGKLEIIQFILLDKCMDRPGQAWTGPETFFNKTV